MWLGSSFIDAPEGQIAEAGITWVMLWYQHYRMFRIAQSPKRANLCLIYWDIPVVEPNYFLNDKFPDSR